MQCCQVPPGAYQMSCKKTPCYLQGEEVPVFYSCLQWLPSFFRAENHQDQETE